MGLFIKQNEPQSQLQSKIAADLAERAKQRSLQDKEAATPAFMDNQKTTTSLWWAWLLLLVLLLCGIGWFLFS